MTEHDTESEDDMRDRRGWHFERRVTIGEVIIFVSLVAMLYFKGNAIIEEFRAAYTQIDKRVSILEVQGAMQKDKDAQQDRVTQEGQQRIELQLTEIQRYLRQGKP
jgi:hypothetical protein